MSTWMRAEPAMRTRESQSRNTAWSRTSREALTRNRWRWRPRSTASGAGAGPGPPGGVGGGTGERAGGEVAGFDIGGADDQPRQPAKGRQPGMAPRRRFGFEKPGAVARGDGLP